MIINDESKKYDIDEKKFSIVITFHNSEHHLEEAIESVLNQDIGFKENVQLILVDAASNDLSLQIALKYEKLYPENILILTQTFDNIPLGRNLAKKYVRGKYVNFFESFDKLGPTCLTKLDETFSKKDVNILRLPICTFTNEGMTPRAYINKGIIDLNENPDLYLTEIFSSFFRFEAIEDLEFDSRIETSHELKFMSQVLLKDNRFMLLDFEDYYYFRKRFVLNPEIKLEKRYYAKNINYLINDLINYSLQKYGEIPYFLKFILIKTIVSLSKDNDVVNILEDDFDDFFVMLKNILHKFTNHEIIEICDYPSNSGFFIAIKNEDITIDHIKENVPSDLLKLKFGKNDVNLLSNDVVIDDLASRSIFLDFVNMRDGVLSFSGFLKSNFNKENISVTAVKEYKNKEVELINATFYDYPTRSTSTMLGYNWEYVYNFDLVVPTRNEKEVSSIRLLVNFTYDNKKISLECPITFRKYCNMSYTSHYYVKENRIVMFNGRFNIMPYSYLKMAKYEIRGLIKLLMDHDFFFKQALFFRVCHLFLYPYMRHKEIWIIMDRKNVADDNAEHFYKYAIQQDDGIKKFFAIYEDSPDYSRLQEAYGNVLPFESIKHRFYYTFADKIISSQGSEFYLNPFRNRRYYLTAGISNIDFYFLQHGIIKDNMSSWLRKYDRNPKLIVTSTELEYKSLFDEGYNYGDKVIQLLGLPRYDNLNNKGYRKQIVIMPSWRNFITDEKSLLESEYFHRFNSLINNERLIKHAKENGYDIIFKPHPELVRYLDLFDENDYVHIDQLKKYQEIFNESAALVTDYSSIFFDFSYLKKPLIYYQYGNDYHYDSENGYFQYETMGFGPVIKDEDELVDKLIEYMENDCIMEDKYKQRVDDFFKYNDHNNSKRCYDWIHEH
ncbi:CDP-glycerol glycerophosphotransferase family protein [Methanobrevibacter sp.]|uniref:CDP-glycerol glycerophosphotransferase family protein n=1 Tax=Methanobrevibacter sp. TaxID=66852 RepID=UPI0025E6B7A4|nr:CDP-glycerol glycerophosphotransferase family protein [Methanobrevibacter sp.]MBQ2666049.1 CDP-glycerol glycerophosphotransferase family protein [Methanobrevibacter sp.]